jgi:glycosyltransferase involved in cell wall biosynthesis
MNSSPNRDNSPKTLIVYWGNFGGGVRLVHNLFLLATEKNLEINFSLSRNMENFSKEYEKSSLSTSFQVTTPRNKFLTVDIFSALYYSFLTVFRMRKKKIDQVVMLMPHPWDFILEILAHFSRIRVLRCIHDATPHSGDLIPSWYIKLIARTSTLNVFFSRAVAERFRHLKKNSTVVDLFDLPFPGTYRRQQNLILFVGRIKEYKGLNLLSDAWSELGTTKLELKVCGSGKGIPEFLKTNATVVNRWLADDEVTRLIGEAKVLVLPYVEASQSGLIPIAESLGTNIVITPIAGLIEQLSSNTSHVISKNFTALALAEAINIAIQLPNIKSNNSNNVGIEMLQAFMRRPA